MIWTLQKFFYRCLHRTLKIVVQRMDMPAPELLSGPGSLRKLPALIIPLIAKRALQEGKPDYPVPTLMSTAQCQAFLRQLLP